MTKTRRGGNPRSLVRWSPLLVLTLLPVAACTGDSPLAPTSGMELTGLVADPLQLGLALSGIPNTVKVTGLVEIVWPGGKEKVIPPGEEKLAFAEFEAFPAADGIAAKGSFTYRVLNPDLSPHREIVAVVVGAAVDPGLRKAWFVAEVVSDTKICSGGSCQDHDDGGGCSDDHSDGGGCDGGDDHSDGGCDHGIETGAIGAVDHTVDGGCSGSDGHDDGGGCSGGDDHGDDGGCSGSDGHGGSGGLPGKDPRVGQFLVGKAHDGGSPGPGNDGITWKWFAPDNPTLPQIDDLDSWPHLCKKTIIGGNLVVHSAPTG